MQTPAKHIALLGGSFDPPHLAHVQIAAHLLNSGRYDEVWVFPSGRHPFKQATASFSDRLEMCRLAFETFGSQVRVSDEDDRSSGFTIDLVRALQARHPDLAFTFVLGSDLKEDIQRWKEGELLQKILPFAFLPRPPAPGSPFPDISSTAVRERVKNRLPIDGFVPKAVEDYITSRQLYR